MVDEHKKTGHKSVRTGHIITVATRRLIRKNTARQRCLATGGGGLSSVCAHCHTLPRQPRPRTCRARLPAGKKTSPRSPRSQGATAQLPAGSAAAIPRACPGPSSHTPPFGSRGQSLSLCSIKSGDSAHRCTSASSSGGARIAPSPRHAMTVPSLACAPHLCSSVARLPLTTFSRPSQDRSSRCLDGFRRGWVQSPAPT